VTKHQKSYSVAALVGLTPFLAVWMVGCANQSSGQAASALSETSAGQVQELPAGSFAVQWPVRLPLQGRQITHLYLTDSQVLVYTSGARCYWIDRASGHVNVVAQAAQRPNDKLFEPAQLPDRVVIPATHELSVFTPAGKLMHRVPLMYSASSGAVGENQRVFLGMDHPNGGRLAAVNTEEQPYAISPAWELMTFGQLSATPAFYDRLIFCGSRDGRVYAVRGEDRAPLWPGLENGVFETGGEILAGLKADRDGVYVASMDTKLYCLRVDTGRVQWVYHAGSALKETSTPVLLGDLVLLHVPGDGVVAIERNAKQDIRKAKWKVDGATQFLAADEDYVYVRGADDRIVAADRQTGQVKFTSQRSYSQFATNAGGKDSTIYAASADGTVYAIRAVVKAGRFGELALAR